MKAVIIKGHGAAVADIKEQSMRPDYIKVKAVALAINPTDVYQAFSPVPVDGILGCDISGIVEEVGQECKSDVKKGDKVFGLCHGVNLSCEEDGAFAEYAMVRDGHIAKIPAGCTFEEAATLGVGITTIGQGLYMTLGFALPGEKAADDVENPKYLLVYGGSSATGTLAIQFAKLSGLTVITTASPENFELVKSRGADVVFDYHDADCARKIKDFTNDTLHHVLDCISTEASYKVVADALPEKSEQPMRVVTLLPAISWPREDITPNVLLAYTTFGEAFSKFGRSLPALPAHFDFGVKFWKLSAELLAAGRIKVHPVALRDGGLAGIPDGLAEHATGNVRGMKLVYRVADVDDEVSGDAKTAN